MPYTKSYSVCDFIYSMRVHTVRKTQRCTNSHSVCEFVWHMRVNIEHANWYGVCEFRYSMWIHTYASESMHFPFTQTSWQDTNRLIVKTHNKIKDTPNSCAACEFIHSICMRIRTVDMNSYVACELVYHVYIWIRMYNANSHVAVEYEFTCQNKNTTQKTCKNYLAHQQWP